MNKKTYSDDGGDSYGKYSDDFDSDDGKRTSTPKKTAVQRKVNNHQYYQDKFRGRGKGSGSMKVANKGRGMRRGRGNSHSSEPANMARSQDNVTMRILSASRNRINELRNKVEELNIQVHELQQENRLFKKMQFRQEKAIRTFEDKENDLPSILDRHNNEIRVLQDQNRRLKEKYEKTDRYLRDAEDELERVKKKLNTYKDMCEDKELKERDELSRKLAQAELDLEEKDVKFKELEKHIEHLKKNHRHELNIEVSRQKELKKQLAELTDKTSQLENQMKEKEKALDYLNIYTNSYQGRASRDISPSDSFTARARRKGPVEPELTPRDKAKFYAEKRRLELFKQKELKEERERKKREQWEKEEKEKKTTGEELPEFVFGNGTRRLDEADDRYKENEERKQRDNDRDNKLKDKEELQSKKLESNKHTERENFERLKKEKEHKEHIEKEKQEREEKERQQRKERIEKERRVNEEYEKSVKKEQEELERKQEKERKERERKAMMDKERERVELERKLQMEREKLDNDPQVQAERKKKDELLRKLQALDPPGNSHFAPAAFKSNDDAETKTSGSTSISESPSRRSEPKEYSFTKPVNNLHQGKPSHENITVPYLDHQKSRRSISDDIAGYQPSFGPTKGETAKISRSKPVTSQFEDDEPIFKITNSSLSSNSATKRQDAKSTNLLESLFGPQANASKINTSNQPVGGNGILSSESVASSLTKAQPWETKTGSTTRSRLEADKTSTFFNGGAKMEDDILGSNGKVLPRRHQQQNMHMFSSKPTVKAVETLEDEIEEFVL